MTNMLIDIPVHDMVLKGDLIHFTNSAGLIIFSHGSGSSRLSPRNRKVAQILNKKGFSTFLFDLLSPEEATRKEKRFDIELLSKRLLTVAEWFKNDFRFKDLNIGLFGASTGSASAIQAATTLGEGIIQAVVSRGGRPDLAKRYLKLLKTPTLLLVGGNDKLVLELNEIAYNIMTCPKKLTVIEGASHLFEEPGTLEQVAEEASSWFRQYLFWPTIKVSKDFIDEW
ncbi:MAG: dienelactone hydrolase family protein [Gracilimonas sp.]|uniref:dienelactone hydrolase family protein n=1 Tax=Gracilimonas sp. TaxID=1974203 RepID=UPI0019CDF746|nr:alpha/beta family hydrolase [Gracilimonas sp.]MBD3616298.1 dienelactone hydrolase family protein [Gracilimonas sp.]